MSWSPSAPAAGRQAQRASSISDVDDGQHRRRPRTLGTRAHAQLHSAMTLANPDLLDRAGTAAISPPSQPKSRSGSSYFDRYPERKLQGPYVPKPALVPAARSLSTPKPSPSPSPSSPSRDSVRFPTSSRDEEVRRVPALPGPSRSGSSTPQTPVSPTDPSPQTSPRRSPVDPRRGEGMTQYADKGTSGTQDSTTATSSLRQAPSSQQSSSAASFKSASSTQGHAQVSSTYAASSAALGKSRLKPMHPNIKPVPVPSIDDIIRSHASTLTSRTGGSTGLAVPMRRMASEGGSAKPRRQRPNDPLFSTYDVEPCASPRIAPARKGVEVFVHSDTSQSSLDSVEQEISEGLDKLGLAGARRGTAAACDEASPRRRSYSGGNRAYGAAELDMPFAQARAFQSLAQLHSFPNNEATQPPPHSSRPRLQEAFVELRGQSKSQTRSKVPPADRFKPADGGTLTKSMSIKGGFDYTYQVSYADVGARAGRPVFVFLGLGAVRYLVGLYDELAVALGLRLICIDRWGLGRSDDIPMERRSILAWSAVVIEVANSLGIDRFSLLAHSAGAPYAMATALVFADRLVGPVHLLSPFTGASAESGYRWLRYVPDGVIRTAQVADWKLQGWKLAKAASSGVQDTPRSARASDTSAAGTPASFVSCQTGWTTFSPARGEGVDAPSGSGEHDTGAPIALSELVTSSSDSTVVSLSTSTPQASPGQQPSGHEERESTRPSPSHAGGSSSGSGPTLRKKSSLSFLGGLLGARPSQSESSSPTSDTHTADSSNVSHRTRPGPRRLSLSRSVSISSTTPSWESQEMLIADEPCEWLDRSPSDSEHLVSKPLPELPHSKSIGTLGTTARRQSRAPLSSGDSSSIYSTPEPGSIKEPEVGLGVALLRASHSESQRGSASDLSLVLGKKPWGFDFTDVRYPCRIWHGSRDERVSLASARWMERSLDNCRLNVVEGAGHNLMSNTSVIFEVLESIQSFANPS